MSEEKDAWYEIEGIWRFINATLTPGECKPVADKDRKSAAWALAAVLHGRDIMKDMGIAKKRGQRGQKYNPDNYTIDTPAFGVVMRWRSGGLKYKDALQEFMNETGMKEVTAKKVMAAIRPRAEGMIKAQDRLYAWATNTAPPDRKF